MGEIDSIKCSNCGKAVENQTQVEDLFGINHNGYTLLIQSWCKKCR